MHAPLAPAPAPRSAVRWGVLLPTFDVLRSGRTPEVVAAARRAEELGFDAGWVGDHLACNCPVLESTLALSAAAAVTDRLTLGFSVLLLGLRPIDLAAQQIATLDALSGGRVVLGVGVGGEHPEEFEAAGVPVARRGRLLDEALAALPELLGGTTTGEHVWPRDSAGVEAGRVPQILIGGRGEAALRRTARFGDGWLPMWLSPQVVRERILTLQELSARAGRATPSVSMLILVNVDDDREAARAAAAEHLAGQYKLPLKVVEHWAALGPAEQVVEQLRAYLDAGVQEFVLMPLGRRPLEQYERLVAVRQAVCASLSH